MQDSGEVEQSSFSLLGLSGAQLLWHAGFVAVPVALFFVGTAQYDLLHAPYLLLLLGNFLWSALDLVPLPGMALLPYRQVNHLPRRVGRGRGWEESLRTQHISLACTLVVLLALVNTIMWLQMTFLKHRF